MNLISTNGGMAHKNKNLLIVKKTGLILFITGLIIFTGINFIGEYRVTDAALKQAEKHLPSSKSSVKIAEKLLPVKNQNYTNKSAFLQAVTNNINHFQISKIALENIKSKGIPTEIIEKLTTLQGKEFLGSDAFLKALTTTIGEKETGWRQYWIMVYAGDANNLDKIELENYRFWLLKASTNGLVKEHTVLLLLLSILLCCAGGLIYFLPGFKELPGIKHNHIFFDSTTMRGLIGILLGGYLISFYILLYWFPDYIVNSIILVDPISVFLKNQPADRWFLYGFLYTLAVTVMGLRMFIKYRHSRYHLVRTSSIIFFQMGFAFLIPNIMEYFNKPGMDFKNAWPLNYSFFTEANLNNLLNSGNLGLFMIGWGIFLAVIVIPVMTYFFGKRWYCSWVCGCGGLAETLGDPFRQLSNKSLKAWKIERLSIYSVLVFAVIMTILQISNFVSNGELFNDYTWRFNQAYSFLIGSAFAGVVGTGFYPLMGNRVWCRFGCPLAAILGIVQKIKSRFVITTNGGQCISCGNCSTYCEMGIDVRWYAQRSQNIVRSSCVGCGVCAAVCPRGVLRLENTHPSERYNVVLDDTILEETLNRH